MPKKDEFLESIYQGEIRPRIVNVARTDFKPWHKPRKHFLRIEQWCSETKKLIKKLKPSIGSEIRYLGLPGEDLLDLRVIKGVCPKGVLLRYLGFDESFSTRLNLAQHEVNSDSSIHLSSMITNDRIENITNPNHMAHKYIQDNAPFDVINLDFCESITHLARNGVIPYLEAIRTLCDIQIKKRGQPWLLFITTRVIRDQLDTQTKQRLFERIIENLSGNQNFTDILSERLGLAITDLQNDLSGTNPLNNERWFDTYVLAISKWLLNYMMGNNYRVSVQMLPSYAYGVDGSSPDMISLAFYLEPSIPPRQDRSGLTRVREPEIVLPTESDLAVDLIKRVADIENVDEKFSADSRLKNKFIQKSSELLAQLRYDMDAYKVFALEE